MLLCGKSGKSLGNVGLDGCRRFSSLRKYRPIDWKLDDFHQTNDILFYFILCHALFFLSLDGRYQLRLNLINLSLLNNTIFE